MAEGVTLKLTGFRELDAALHKLDQKVAEKIAKAGCRAGARLVQQVAIRNAPLGRGKTRSKGKGRMRGTLRAGIKLSLKRIPGYSVVYWVQASKDAFYAHMVEWGTKQHTIKAKHKEYLTIPTRKGLAYLKQVTHPGIRKRLFLTRAFEDNWKRALEKMKTTMWPMIEKEYKRAR